MPEINNPIFFGGFAFLAILFAIIVFVINRPDKSSLEDLYKPIVYDDKWKPDTTTTESETTEERYLEDEPRRKS